MRHIRIVMAIHKMLETKRAGHIRMLMNIRINGITFFKGQSLSYPCPLEKEEVEECLENMLNKINERADLILKKYNEEHKSNS